MWITALAAGWVVGCVSLYTFLVRTAKEPEKAQCMDCQKTECTNCPYVETSQQQFKRAA